MSDFQTLSFSLDLDQDVITKLRFLYPESGYDTHDSVSLQSITLSNRAQNKSSFLYFDRVDGKDQDNKTATAANDYGLYLNSGVTGANPDNDDAFGYNLNFDNLIIDGTELSKFTDNILFSLELHELNEFDGSVQINFQGWFEELGEWKDIGTISTTDKKEYNADWQQITNLPSSQPPIIGFDDSIPIPTPPLIGDILVIKQPENEENVGDFIADEDVGWTLAGDDSGLFEIDSDGYLKFKIAPDYENPIDNGKDNNYDLSVIAIDVDLESTTQQLAIEVTDESECGIVIENEGTNYEVLKYDSDPFCLDESIWLSISLTDSLIGKLTNSDWVGVRILNDEGTVISVNGLGHGYTDNNQEVLSSKPLLVELDANESLQLTRLNPPQVGGETLQSVDIKTLPSGNFEAILGGNFVLNIDKLDEEPSSWDIKQESIQNTPSEGIFDFSDLGDGRDFTVTLSGDSGFINTVGVVKLEQSNNGFTVNGVSSDAGAAFRDAVKSNIQGFDGGVIPSVGGGVYEKEFAWTIDDEDEGIYALAMISQTGEVYTFGTDTSADGRQHIKELGSWTWGFEDMVAAKADWDFNDAIVMISQVLPK